MAALKSSNVLNILKHFSSSSGTSADGSLSKTTLKILFSSLASTEARNYTPGHEIPCSKILSRAAWVQVSSMIFRVSEWSRYIHQKARPRAVLVSSFGLGLSSSSTASAHLLLIRARPTSEVLMDATVPNL